MTTNTKLTLEQALTLIQQDGQRTEQQTWDGRWAVSSDYAPSTRHSTIDLTEAEVIKYAEMIRLVQEAHMGRM